MNLEGNVLTNIDPDKAHPTIGYCNSTLKQRDHRLRQSLAHKMSSMTRIRMMIITPITTRCWYILGREGFVSWSLTDGDESSVRREAEGVKNG